MGWFGWLKSKKEWALVATMHIDVVVGHGTPQEENGRLSFYLYEAPDESRKIESKHSVSRANDNYDGIGEYTEKIYPWLKGMHFSDIPSYWDVKRKDNDKYIKHMYTRLLRGQK